MTKFKNLKDHPISFTLHGELVKVAAGATFDVKDDHAFAIKAMGVPAEPVTPLPEPEEPKLDGRTKEAKAQKAAETK